MCEKICRTEFFSKIPHFYGKLRKCGNTALEVNKKKKKKPGNTLRFHHCMGLSQYQRISPIKYKITAD